MARCCDVSVLQFTLTTVSRSNDRRLMWNKNVGVYSRGSFIPDGCGRAPEVQRQATTQPVCQRGWAKDCWTVPHLHSRKKEPTICWKFSFSVLFFFLPCVQINRWTALSEHAGVKQEGRILKDRGEGKSISEMTIANQGALTWGEEEAEADEGVWGTKAVVGEENEGERQSGRGLWMATAL